MSWICKLDFVFVYNARQSLTHCRRVSALPTPEKVPLPNDCREKPDLITFQPIKCSILNERAKVKEDS